MQARVPVDSEQGLLRLHINSALLLQRLLGTRGRKICEFLSLLIGICLLLVLVTLHIQFVHQNVQKGECLRDLLHENGVTLNNTEIIQIKIHGFWSKLYSRIADKLAEAQASSTKETSPSSSQQQHNEESTRSEHKEMLLSDSLLMYALGENYKDFLAEEEVEEEVPSEHPVIEEEDPLNYFIDFSEYEMQLLGDPVYEFALEKAYLILPTHLREKHNIRVANITLPVNHTCFGGAFESTIIEESIGYDTIILNNVWNLFGKGYLYNVQSGELFNLYHTSSSEKSIDDILFEKIGVFVTSLMMFFTTSSLVALSLREVQFLVLQFITDLHHIMRTSRAHYNRLLLTHITKSILFFLIILGVMFWVAEFMDGILALLIVSIMWFGEMFTAVSVRRKSTIQFFPRFFFLYTMFFQVYYFSQPLGFTYVAFATYLAFLQHLVMYFFNREVDAILNGSINSNNPREGFRRPPVRRVLVQMVGNQMNINRGNPNQQPQQMNADFQPNMNVPHFHVPHNQPLL